MVILSAGTLLPTIDAEHYERDARRANSPHPELWDMLDRVKDPEVPVLSIWDLGVLRDVRVQEGGIEVVLTPTYSGCPAMKEIQADVQALLSAAGFSDVRILISLAPAWTTDWLSEAGRNNLRDYGIAPPDKKGQAACPQCGSQNTNMISEFGSTSCKALYKCDSCLEPFDYFKCI